MVCRYCGVGTEFYPYRPRKCKECVKADVHAHRAANIEAARARDRVRARRPEAIAAVTDVVRRWRALHPGRAAAHCAVHRAIARGTLVRPETCQTEGCGRGRPEAHHDDYSKPLEVRWLCKPCHVRADAERRAREDARLRSSSVSNGSTSREVAYGQ